MSMNLEIQCDTDECYETENIDVVLDKVIDMHSLQSYLSDCMGWSFGEYKDDGQNQLILCPKCTNVRENHEDSQVQNQRSR